MHTHVSFGTQRKQRLRVPTKTNHHHAVAICYSVFAIMNEITPEVMLVQGFRTIKGLPTITVNNYNSINIDKFKEHFGIDPIVAACIWQDIVHFGNLENKHKNEKGLRKWFIAIHFLWAYPRNNGLLASTCGTCKRNVEGEERWKWVRLIASLKSERIKWPEARYNDANGQKFLCSVDGTDFKTDEVSTDQFNIDSGTCTKKIQSWWGEI